MSDTTAESSTGAAMPLSSPRPSSPSNPSSTTNIDDYNNNLVPLLLSSNILAHYAILAVFDVLGATVEHVQILTRLITIVANDVVGVKLYSIFTILSKKIQVIKP